MQITIEKELVRKILKGETKLFEEIIKQYQKLVVAIANRFADDQYELEEVSQEIFIKVYQNLAGFQFKSKLSTWIGRIAYNHCINYMKKNSKKTITDLDNEINEKNITDTIFNNHNNNFENRFEKKEIFALVNSKIDQLPQLYQTILNLFHLQEMSYSEISEILELPEGTVKSYLFRSRKLLKEKLLSSYKEEEFI